MITFNLVRVVIVVNLTDQKACLPPFLSECSPRVCVSERERDSTVTFPIPQNKMPFIFIDIRPETLEGASEQESRWREREGLGNERLKLWKALLAKICKNKQIHRLVKCAFLFLPLSPCMTDSIPRHNSVKYFIWAVIFWPTWWLMFSNLCNPTRTFSIYFTKKIMALSSSVNSEGKIN